MQTTLKQVNNAQNVSFAAVQTQVQNFAALLQNALNANSIAVKRVHTKSMYNNAVICVLRNAANMQQVIVLAKQIAAANNVCIYAIRAKKFTVQFILHKFVNATLLHTNSNCNALTLQQIFNVLHNTLQQYAATLRTRIFSNNCSNMYCAMQAFVNTSNNANNMQNIISYFNKTFYIVVNNNAQQKAVAALQNALLANNISATVKQNNTVLAIKIKKFVAN